MVAEVVEILEVKWVLPGSTALPPAWLLTLLAVSPLCSLCLLRSSLHPGQRCTVAM